MAGLAGTWLTPLAQALARQAEKRPGRRPQSLILLWLSGGPSQLETFDPHPGTKFGGEVRAIGTSARGVQIASGLEQTAEVMNSIALVRSTTSREGDHERAIYNMKTGFRPDPTLVHPSLGAVVCHQHPNPIVEIPNHISILPDAYPGRGGYLGDELDAFKVVNPGGRVQDVRATVPQTRFDQRVKDLINVVEPEFARGRLRRLDQQKTLHQHSINSAVRMMSSEQLNAFDLENEPEASKRAYGNSPFGLGCLTAVRLIQCGVRCVEVTLSGWDSHINNHELQSGRIEILDPALAALIKDLKARDLFQDTLVVCGGEFGRTPRINPAGGRDHWPHGFSIALAGGPIRGGQVIGATSPQPKLDEQNRLQDVKDPHDIADVHATILHSFGVDFQQELDTPIGRPMAISQGRVIQDLLA